MNGLSKKEEIRLKKLSRQRFGIVFATTGLILILTIGFLVASNLLKTYSINFCLQILEQEALNTKNNIDDQLSFFQNDMDILAEIIQEEDLSSPQVQNLLKIFEDKELISRIGIMFPDNQVLLSNGEIKMSSGNRTFDELVQNGSFLSNAEPDGTNSHNWILYYTIPIGEQPDIKGLLFGVMELNDIAHSFNIEVFDGEADFYIMDPENMNLVLDTLHGHPGHSDATEGHQIKEGFYEEQISYDFAHGHSGLTAYLSTSLNEYLYTSYEPLDVNHWFIMLSVPESIVFDEAEYTKTVLFWLGVFESIVLIIYFLWILLRSKREMKLKEYQIQHIHYMYNVQHILFDAYRQQENISLSLKQIAAETKARSVLLAAIDNNKVCRIFSSQDSPSIGDGKQREKQLAQALAEDMLLRNTAYIASAENPLTCQDDNLKKMISQFGISQWMAIPIEGQAGRLIGVLAAINTEHPWCDITPLTSVALSFSMALYNIQAYQTIEKMGTTDSLTNLWNRNAYEQKMKQFETVRPDRITCVYADANGLHELNNSQGHAAGDKMLQCVANSLKDAFENGSVFRIGGDEFLVITDMEEEEAAAQAAAAKQNAQNNGYHVSIGTASGDSAIPAITIVKTAEKRMYEDKRLYYMGSRDRRQVR